jgi:hypothetical protein
MKKRLLLLVLMPLLAVAALVLPVKTAEAHNYDNSSAWFCAMHRPTDTVLVHSWPSGMENGVVYYWCRAGFYGVDHQYWVRWDQATNTSTRPWPYQKCKPASGGITWCGTAGH